MNSQPINDNEALLNALGIEIEANPQIDYTPKEQRVLADFEEMQQFIQKNGTPSCDENACIFERLYAVRLDRIRKNHDLCELLGGVDRLGLLTDSQTSLENHEENLSDASLVDELGITDEAEPITTLVNVRSAAEKNAAEEIAVRKHCKDFSLFRPAFARVKDELHTGKKVTQPFKGNRRIQEKSFFILGGQTAYLAHVGRQFKQVYGQKDARLRIIFDNGTESNLLLRSFQRALEKDETSRRIVDGSTAPLIDSPPNKDDQHTGVIYVLKSKCKLNIPSEIANCVHKIGSTTGTVRRRISNAQNETTYLNSEVEVVEEFNTYNIDATRFEAALHKFFSFGRLDILVENRHQNIAKPNEWFVVPLPVIREAVERISDRSIVDFKYDLETLSIVSKVSSEDLASSK